MDTNHSSPSSDDSKQSPDAQQSEHSERSEHTEPLDHSGENSLPESQPAAAISFSESSSVEASNNADESSRALAPTAGSFQPVDSEPAQTNSSSDSSQTPSSESVEASSREIDEATRREKLSIDVQFLRGLGPKRGELLAKLGLRTARDLIFNFPRNYERIEPATPIEHLIQYKPATVVGTIKFIEERTTRKGLYQLIILADVDHGRVKAMWFNQKYLRGKIFQGLRALISGTAKFDHNRWTFINPKLIPLREDEETPNGQILPIYSLTEGLQQRHIRLATQHVVEECVDVIAEVLPERVRQRAGLVGIQEALRAIHLPRGEEELLEGRRRLVYQELFVLQLALAIRRRNLLTQCRSPALPVDSVIDARIVRLFPFDLTPDQRRCVDEIAADMGRPVPMNRLLQGDVGSGKTVVAFYAMLLAVAHQHQAVLMAPTEILAQQHLKNLRRLLAHSKVQVAILTGGVTDAEKRRVYAGIKSGEIQLVVGTQALLQQSVEFQKLGLVVVDEQHKFGVKQRAQLRASGVDPHYLVMTATPIPRTMTMTAFGDLDVSTLRQGPPSRKSVHTYLAEEDKRESWWGFFRKKLDEGRQGYVITPLVDESEHKAWMSVKAAFEDLTNGPLANYRIDLLHGRMSNEEKTQSMMKFATGETQVLVSTSVVEVGVDVPNATLMTIESGERFGLSQLHQLRGRVARGKHPGYVCVFANTEVEDSKQRLEAFTRTTDGFELAEIDFKLRGPGDMLGTRQSGLPPLRIADLHRDGEVVIAAREHARQLLESDPQLAAEDLQLLRKQVLTRYGAVIDLGDVG